MRRAQISRKLVYPCLLPSVFECTPLGGLAVLLDVCCTCSTVLCPSGLIIFTASFFCHLLLPPISSMLMSFFPLAHQSSPFSPVLMCFPPLAHQSSGLMRHFLRVHLLELHNQNSRVEIYEPKSLRTAFSWFKRIWLRILPAKSSRSGFGRCPSVLCFPFPQCSSALLLHVSRFLEQAFLLCFHLW